MSVRLSALVLGIAVLLAGGAITYAAAPEPTTPTNVVAHTAGQQQTLLVPDVRGQAYVFAKGILLDSGFAWRVHGKVRGYAANLVATQVPEPGTRVVDNGAPTLTLTLTRNAKYKQEGAPQDLAPYGGSPIRLADLASSLTPPPAPKQAAAPKVSRKAETALKSKTTTHAKTAYPQQRPRAFVVAGAPREPLDEMPLPDRAKLLDRWLGAHPKPTDANVQHWLYQNAWIVQGAKFGWWRGAEALRLLVQVDRHAETRWHIGSKSVAVAQATLASVAAKQR
jgi:hypothetical protein